MAGTVGTILDPVAGTVGTILDPVAGTVGTILDPVAGAVGTILDPVAGGRSSTRCLARSATRSSRSREPWVRTVTLSATPSAR